MKKGQRIGLANHPLGKSGEKFISKRKRGEKPWAVRITTHGTPKQITVGSFETIEEAIEARDKYLSR